MTREEYKTLYISNYISELIVSGGDLSITLIDTLKNNSAGKLSTCPVCGACSFTHKNENCEMYKEIEELLTHNIKISDG